MGVPTQSGLPTLKQIGGGQLPDDTWGYINVSWPFLRLLLTPDRVQFEPTFLRNWIIFRVPTWDASWSELQTVRAEGSHVVFVPRTGPVWTFFCRNRNRICDGVRS